MNADFTERLSRETEHIEEIIFRYLPESSGPAAPLAEAMCYSVKNGGKRLRPILMEHTCRIFGGAEREAIDPMLAAIEYIHSFSLVHDDLPAIDNDDLRRGHPTTHIQYGEARAILAGDALLNYAFETALKSIRPQREGASLNGRALDACQVLFRKAGLYGMAGGQDVDVAAEKEGLSPDAALLDFINENKTAALIEAAMMCGALLAGASDEQVKQVEQAARALGRAFQIQDDILDVLGDEEKLGKPVGSDEKNLKTTYVDILGPEGAKAEADALTRRAIEIMSGFEGDDRFLTELFAHLTKRES